MAEQLGEEGLRERLILWVFFLFGGRPGLPPHRSCELRRSFALKLAFVPCKEGELTAVSDRMMVLACARATRKY